MHVEAGHTSPPEEGPKDLRCPLCLYHTRHKSNMIDHIVLHRDDRVAPLEVSRSKLSRHLQGLVFRCHKCTFTCSSDLALQQHLRKHAELKPYQCQLCYYDSSQRHQLEEHLRLEHKVLRNFELMGRVNLDQLEMMKEQGNSTDEEESEMAAVEEEDEGVVALGDELMEEKDFEQGGDLKDEEMEEGIKEEVDENEEEEKEAKIAHDLAAPSCNNSNVSGGGSEKRLPCEFCGRCFTNGTEWERHVLRHGMTVSNNRADSSSDNAPAIEASASPSIGSAGIAHKDLDLSSNSMDVEGKYPNNLSERRQNESEDDKGLLETKKDQ
ncbi:zinc finger protein 462 [Aplochiton taeniatus]